MTPTDQYYLSPGKCVGNLHSLECMLRVVLMKHYHETESGLELNEGDSCRATWLTNYKTLGELIDAYHQIVPSEFKLDKKSVLKFRDAIAHGRSVNKGDALQTLIKFSPVKGGMVSVMSRIDLTEGYLKQMVMDFYNQVIKVHNYHIKYQPN